ncbi:MAG: hypothetical protein ACXWW0_07555 [Bacteroidia bacterium]
MRKKITYFTVLFLFISAGFFSCKSNKDVTEKRNPHHKLRPESPVLKSIKKYVTTSRSGADTLLQVEEFDKNGYKIKLRKYLPDGQAEYEITYTNNSDGKPEKAVTKYMDGSTDSEEHTYNRQGKVVATDWKRGDGSSGRHEYVYDDEGEIVQWDWYESGRLVMTRLYPITYNEQGKPQEGFYKETTNKRDTSTVNHYQYTYDDKNRLTSKLSLEREMPLSLEEYIYDSLDNKVIQIFYEPDSVNSGTFGLGTKQFNVYNEYGELVQYQTAYDRENINETVNNTYDEYGHLVQTIYEGADGSYRKERYMFEYWK